MKTKYNFTLLENIEEFETWLKNQKNYNYNGIQIHHTYLPNYKNFYKSDGSHEDELTRQYNIKNYHVNTNKWGDIAQHFTIFPNGKICTGRTLSSTTPVGIKGWNSNKICVEIYGNFDKGQDIMTIEQKNSTLALYYLLCTKFNIKINNINIKPHCHFSTSGTYLGEYNISKSVKSCPGTNFFGYGNSKKDIDKFIEDIKNYKESSFLVKIISDELNVRKEPSLQSAVVTKLKKGDVYTIIEKTQDDWGKLKSCIGWIRIKDNYVTKL